MQIALYSSFKYIIYLTDPTSLIRSSPTVLFKSVPVHQLLRLAL